MSLHLGFLTHVHGDQPAAELYRELVELFVVAEELGFDSGWVAQHHLQPRRGRLPSPLVLLSAVAQRTSRIQLGTAVVVLPLEHPLRLAEDATVLDALSGGRLQLGLGTGGPSADEFAAFGHDVEERRTRYASSRAPHPGPPCAGSFPAATGPPSPPPSRRTSPGTCRTTSPPPRT